MKNTINPAAAAVHFMKGERIAYTTPGQNKLAILREIKAGYPEGEPRYAFFYEDRSLGPDSGKFLHFSAAGSIRAALKAGRRVTVQELVPVAEVRESGAFVVETAPATPGLPLVPLGVNRTRDGRDVRVICNDLKNPRFPVCYVCLLDDGSENEGARFVSATGSYLNHGEAHAFDLVGHLPPEPVKPREFWIIGSLTHPTLPWSVASTRIDPDPTKEIIHVREVTPAAGKQHQVWVRDSDGHVTSVLNDAENLGAHGYRKALMMEVQP